MWRAMWVVAAMLLGSSCHVVVDDGWPDWTWNWDPIVVAGDAGCAWDSGTREFYWTFEAQVDDVDGASDIWAVDANVYDVRRGGVLVDTFELERSVDPWWWSGDFPEHTTYLDCHYSGYSVDLVVWDIYDGWDVLTLRPRTFATPNLLD